MNALILQRSTVSTLINYFQQLQVVLGYLEYLFDEEVVACLMK